MVRRKMRHKAGVNTMVGEATSPTNPKEIRTGMIKRNRQTIQGRVNCGFKKTNAWPQMYL